MSTGALTVARETASRPGSEVLGSVMGPTVTAAAVCRVAKAVTEEQQEAHRGQEEGCAGASADDHACEAEDRGKDGETRTPEALARRRNARWTGSDHAAGVFLVISVRQELSRCCTT
jgi:hypothetical protein